MSEAGERVLRNSRAKMKSLEETRPRVDGLGFRLRSVRYVRRDDKGLTVVHGEIGGDTKQFIDGG